MKSQAEIVREWLDRFREVDGPDQLAVFAALAEELDPWEVEEIVDLARGLQEWTQRFLEDLAYEVIRSRRLLDVLTGVRGLIRDPTDCVSVIEAFELADEEVER